MVLHHVPSHFGRFKTTTSSVGDSLQRTTAKAMVAMANGAMPDWSNEMAPPREQGINLQKE
jgi:hypothetical protein